MRLTYQVRPLTFRATQEQKRLKPDLALATAVGDFEDHWFLEIDLATESIPAVIRKCAVYQSYKASGLEQALLGLFPAVVWLVADQHRRERLKAAIGADKRLDGRVFRVVEPTTMLRLAGLPDDTNHGNRGGEIR